MNFLGMNIDNSFFAGYAMECDEAFNRKMNNILDRCGARLPAYQLTEELKREGISLENLSPDELQLLDAVFDVD